MLSFFPSFLFVISVLSGLASPFSLSRSGTGTEGLIWQLATHLAHQSRDKFILLFILKHVFIVFLIAPLQATLYSEALPTTVRTLCRSFHAKAHRAVVSERLAQGQTWRLWSDSNPRRSS